MRRPLFTPAVVVAFLVAVAGFVFLRYIDLHFLQDDNASERWTAIFSGVLALFSFCGLLLIILQIKDSQTGRLEQATIESLDRILAKQHPIWEKIYERFEGVTPIPPNFFDEKSFLGEKINIKDEEIKGQIIQSLITLEYFAVGTNTKIYCPNITNKLSGQNFLNLNRKFRHFLELEKNKQSGKYVQFPILCHKIRKQNRKLKGLKGHRSWYYIIYLKSINSLKRRKIVRFLLPENPKRVFYENPPSPGWKQFVKFICSENLIEPNGKS